MNKRIFHAMVIALALPLASAASAGSGSGYYRFPAISPDAIVFTSEGDLWRSSAAGGIAQRLTTHHGNELRASISPDGRTLAFTAGFDGPSEVYVMPVAGGQPKRLTFEGEAALVVGWTPAGEVIYSTGRHSKLPARQLATVNPQTLVSTVLPSAKARDGSVSADGMLFFTRNGVDANSDNARRYRGGSMAQIWALDLKGKAEAKPLTTNAQGNNSQAMFWQGQVYFVSDRDGARNLWRMKPDGSGAEQLTRHSAKDFEIRQAQLHSGKIVYSFGADLRVFDIASKQDKLVNVNTVSDLEQQRERWSQRPLQQFHGASISPNGERLAIAARGKLIVAGTGNLRRIELPVPSGTRARAPAFAQDNASVWALADETGEFELTRYSLTMTKPEVFTTPAKPQAVTRLRVFPSPNGKLVVHDDLEHRLWITDVASKETRLLTQSIDAADGVVWSPDSTAIAFTQSDKSRRANDQLWLLRVADGKKIALTTQRYATSGHAFTPDGAWLYFISDRTLNAQPNFPWGSRNMGPAFDKRDRIYALHLQEGGAKAAKPVAWPFLPRTELTTGLSITATSGVSASATASTAAASSTTATAAKSTSTTATVNIDWAALEADPAKRLHIVPAGVVPAGNYQGLQTDGKRVWFMEMEAGTFNKGTLKSAALELNAVAADTHSTDVSNFALSANGKKLMVGRLLGAGASANREFNIFDAGAKPPTVPAELARTQVRLGDWQVKTNPREEWRQLFVDAWRMHRDFFYARDMHGNDWPAIRAKYEPLLDRVTDRAELADLMAQMVAEVNALHSQIGAGDVRTAVLNVSVGALGAAYKTTEQGVQLDTIYDAEPELPGNRGPLQLPGVDAQVGDVITAINNKPIKTLADLNDALRGEIDKQVLLTLLRAGVVHQTVVVPTATGAERNFAHTHWEWANRRRVEKDSAGRYGYIHLRAMGGSDLATFAREFYPIADRDGLIIDVRGNGGGSIDSILIEKLLRRAWTFWQNRYTDEGDPNMQNSFRGHIVVLIDEGTYSDGETFAEGMKRLKLATIIGERTAGAGIWLSDQNRLADGGIARAAQFAQFSLDGEWLIEGKGVTPDIEVVNLPRATFNGADAQLDAAMAELKKKLAEQPVRSAKTPKTPKM